MSSNKFVVYTCITGNYDTLREIRYVSPDIDYICFTDNAALTSKTWKIRQIPNDLKNIDQIKKQRLLKILPHKYLPEYSVSLWLDSNIEIISDVKDFFNKYDLSKTFLYTNKHPTRDCIYREQLAVIRLKKDTYENTNPQINRYRDEGYPEHYGLAETNIMLRAHNNLKCVKLMNLWGEEILNGSHRDQLSFNYAIWKSGYKDFVQYLDEKYYNLHLGDSAFFKLKKHLRIDKFVPFAPIFIDTKEIEKESINKENEVKVQEEKHKKQEDIIKKIDKSKIQEETQKKQEEKKKEEPIKKISVEKPLSVVVFTHNRTNVAVETIKSLIKNLKYSNIKWIISDDRSNSGHIEELLKTFAAYKIKPKVCKTTKYKFGLGASMNNGLKEAFKYSDVVLRVEDDWLLERELDIGKHVKTISTNNKVAGIRLGMVGGGIDTDPKYYGGKNYKVLFGPNVKSWLLVNQVFLVHKRLHDKLGWYLENVDADKTEEDFRERYNRFSDNGKKNMFILFPSEIKWRTFDDPSLYFIHIGRSTLGHSIYREPKRYSWIYETKQLKKKEQIKTNDSVEEKKKSDNMNNDEGFDVVYVLGGVSPHNNEELRYSLRSIEKFVKGVRNVFVVGKNPGFLSDKVIYIPTTDLATGDLKNKDRNHWHNMEIVCNDPRLSENFLFAADDFLVIKDSKWSDFSPRHTGLATKRYMDAPNYSNWTAVRKATLKRFPENKRYLWHPHMISQMNKTKVLQCCKDSDYKNRSDVVIFSYYFNHDPMPKPVFDFDTQELHTAKTMDLSKRHVSHWEEAFSYKPFKDQLKALFPTKSKYESYDIGEEKDKSIMASVILPCYNCEKYVGQTLDSILGHNKVNYEIICVDDKSTDKSLEIIEKYANEHPNIKIIKHETNQGLSISRNDALKTASGKYIVLIDSDDKFVDGAIDTIVENMEKYQLDIFYLNLKAFFDSPDIEKKYERYKKYYKRPQLPKVVDGRTALTYFYSKGYNGFGSCENAFRREFLIDTGVKYIESILYEDNPYNLYALLNAKRVFNTTKELYLRRIRLNSIVTQNKNFKHFRSYMCVCRDIVKTAITLPMQKELQTKIFRYLIQVHFANAERVYMSFEKNKNVFSDINNFKDAKKFIEMFKTIRKNKSNFKIYTKVFYGK